MKHVLFKHFFFFFFCQNLILAKSVVSPPHMVCPVTENNTVLPLKSDIRRIMDGLCSTEEMWYEICRLPYNLPSTLTLITTGAVAGIYHTAGIYPHDIYNIFIQCFFLILTIILTQCA